MYRCEQKVYYFLGIKQGHMFPSMHINRKKVHST